MIKEVCYIMDWEDRTEIQEKCLACEVPFYIVKDKGLNWNEKLGRFERFEWTIWTNERYLLILEKLFAPYV